MTQTDRFIHLRILVKAFVKYRMCDTMENNIIFDRDEEKEGEGESCATRINNIEFEYGLLKPSHLCRVCCPFFNRNYYRNWKIVENGC